MLTAIIAAGNTDSLPTLEVTANRNKAEAGASVQPQRCKIEDGDRAGIELDFDFDFLVDGLKSAAGIKKSA